jgi:hypothetical protein
VLKDNAEAIQRCFSGDTAEDIFARLEKEDGDWAASTLKTLRRMSPTSIKVRKEACHHRCIYFSRLE